MMAKEYLQGRSFATSILVGYLALISYTWPQDFIPIVSIQSLPLVLAGLVLTALSGYVALLVMFFPLTYSEDKDDWFRQTIFGEMYETELPDKNRDLEALSILKMRISHLLMVIRQKRAWVGAVYMIVTSCILIYFSINMWASLITGVSHWFAIFIVLPFIYFGYRAIGELIKISGVPYIWSLIKVLFFLVVFPAWILPIVDGKTSAGNVLVEAGLQRLHLGGGIPVVVNAEENGFSGELLFYDGNKAWLRSSDGELVEMDVKSMRWLSEKKQSK